MQLRRAVLHRLLRVEDKGQRLIFHLERADALMRRDLVLRDDDRHVVAPVADVPVEQKPVGDILMSRVHRPRMARRRERNVRHIEAGEHLHNAGNSLCRGCIDGLHHRVGDLRMLDADVERIRRHAILVVFRPAGRLVEGVDADFASANLAHGNSSSFS